MIGRLVQVFRPHQAPEHRTHRPDATLFKAGHGLFWRYVDPLRAHWHRPPIPADTFSAAEKQEIGFLNAVHTEQIRDEFPQVMWSLRDSIGYGFD